MSQLNSILSRIGEFGRFQKRVYGLLNFLVVFRCCQMFLLVFVADKPRWRCGGNDGQPLTTNGNFPCLANGSLCESVQFSSEFSSITSEWRLVCDQEYKRSLASAIVMAGCFLGAVLFGGMADKQGRKQTIVVLSSIASFACIASGFSQSFEQFLFFRFVAAVMLNGSSTAVFVLISETVGRSSKDMLLTAHQAFYAIGYLVLGLFAYFIRDWRYLTITVSLPIVFCSAFLLPNGLCESPQWLVENGKIEEGKQLLRDIAKENGEEISETSLEKLSSDAPKTNVKNSQSNTSVFARPGYLKKVLILSATWLFLAMMYYGLSFASGNLSSNKYISFSLCGLVEIPALFLSMWFIKSGRRKPLSCLALIGSLACLVCGWLQGMDQSNMNIITVLALLGKFGVAACYNIIYIFSAEHFGASVKGFSMGIFSIAASIGSILAPLVIGLEVYDKRIPMVCFGIGAIFAAGLVLTLPETVKVSKSRKTK
ncbi:solute carrier family 22 member 15-like [Dendronephthya gigantea]|uniref:solute carrier family 22 member 15-like n=1 Tax=Dendronephthya gigantea TaxID=151771 RepID=UPI00106C100C|nr:solute carrier family 22 member 15-like [Dendronephthya gigantea]XP_028396632.1 solute carrier family 22 member 15-like [Dendronephthya gigantea]